MPTLRRTKNLITAVAAAAIGSLALAAGAGAATVSVNSTADSPAPVNDGQCTLREAIESTHSNNNLGGCSSAGAYGLADVVDVPGGTYLLNGVVILEDRITIRGVGPGTAVIDQAANNSVFITDNLDSQNATFENVVIQGGQNTAGGLINNTANSLVIRNSTLRGGDAGLTGGGAISSIQGANESVTIENSTITGNTAAGDGGGLRLAGGDITIRNSTITDNTADDDNDVEIDTGGGFAFSAPDTVTMSNTIVSGNRVLGNGTNPNCAGQVDTHGGVSVYGDQAPNQCQTGPNDKIVADAGLAPLADNGGLTPTHALLDGSPARDAGIGCLAIDQRGVERGLGGTCDVGAYERVDCEGRAANRIGTVGDETLTGTEGADVFVALAGNDTVNTGGGDDLVCAGDGNDTVSGAGGNDRMLGEAGNDRLDGADGDDTAVGADGDDTLDGGAGNDVADAGAGNDRIEGGDGNDRAKGGDGNDSASGGDGNDNLAGQGGKDVLKGGAGKDKLNGGQGKDKLKGNAGKDKCVGSGGKDKGSSCEKESSIP